MKRFAIFLLLMLSISATTFAQTKVNSGKNFVTYSYDSWDKAAEDYIALCEEYGLKYLYLLDNSDFSRQEYFTVNSGEWNFYIVRRADKEGIKGSLIISSPEGRQTELAGCSEYRFYSITNIWVDVNYYNTYNPKEYTDNLKLRYSFLGEPIP
ncbi:MAG: hypothetical protein IIU15_01675 [Treponema sp.]|nr:hypothetical protein [Treponema sp.]